MAEPVPGQVTSADGTLICLDRSGAWAARRARARRADRPHPPHPRGGRSTAGAVVLRASTTTAAAAAGAATPRRSRLNVRSRTWPPSSPLLAGQRWSSAGHRAPGLALRAAVQLAAISKLAVWEPPYHVDATAPASARTSPGSPRALVAAGRRGDAVELFMVEAAEMPVAAVAAMRAGPGWEQAEAIAHTLAYEADVMGHGNALPACHPCRTDPACASPHRRVQPGVADQRREGGDRRDSWRCAPGTRRADAWRIPRRDRA